MGDELPHDSALERPALVELRSFRVRLFRSILDSGAVPVFPLTALVGRNQSGKTSLLEALFRLHPRAPRGYDAERDWPAERRRLRVAQSVPCRAEFNLPLEVARELAALAGLAAPPRTLALGRSYGGALEVELDGAPSAEPGALEATAAALLPPFVLLGREGLLEGSHDLAALARARAQGAGSAAERTFLALLELAGLELGALRAPLSRGGDKGRLAHASQRLTALLRARRPGARALALEGSGGRLALFLATGERGGLRPLESCADEERWRLSLDVLLERFGHGARGRTVLLLDEPARHFRGAAEGALREELAELARVHTVLHTAPLPFRTSLTHEEQVLVLGWSPSGPVLRGGPLPGSEGSFELRAALGMGGRHGFLVGETHLVVEGQQDAHLLETLSALARRSGEAGLPAELEIVAAGGAYEVAHVAAFLARRGLGVVALFDGDEGGRAGRAELLQRWRRERPPRRALALDLGRALGLRQMSSIEDLFPPGWYFALAQERQGIDAGSLPPGDKLADRVGAAFAARGERFDKGQVNEAVRAALESAPDFQSLPPELARRARRLLATLRRALERVR